MPRAAKPAPGPLSLAVAEILRVELARLGRTKSDLSRQAGISRTVTSDIVRGLSQADIEQLDAMCQALGRSLTDVLKEADQATTKRLLDSGIQPFTR